MKNLVLCVSFLVLATSSPAAMVRVAAVTDSHTIVLDGGKSVALRGVVVPAEEETMARDYLARLVVGWWVMVESNGDVYRSPDALFINGEVARRAYLSPIVKAVFLGELYDGPRKPDPAPAGRARVTASRTSAARRRRR